MIIDFSIHSFCLWHHFRHVQGFDAIAFADLAGQHGFTGINLSLNDAMFRHLGGRETWRMDAVRERLATTGMSLEVDTSGTDPVHLEMMIGVAARMGARTMRFYTRHTGTVGEMLDRTVADLCRVMPVAADAGITLVIENHEDFTGPQIRQIVERVNHPNLKVLFDYGNSQMLLEDPLEALEAVLPYVYSIHMKDHVMIRPEHAPSGRLTVAGVPIGRGFVPFRALTQRLLAAGLRRLTFESVWAYSAPVVQGCMPGQGVELGKGAFSWREAPFSPHDVILDQSRHTGGELVSWEKRALEEGVQFTRALLEECGVTGYQAYAQDITQSLVEGGSKKDIGTSVT